MAARTVYITGASSGIGREIALAFAAKGAHVAIGARRQGELEALAKQIQDGGGRALVLPVDVADPEAAMDAVKKADRDLGALEMVIANAGVGSYGHASTLTWEQVSRSLDVNVKGAVATITAAIPIFLAHQRGHLVGVTSLAGLRGMPKSAVYSMGKAAFSTFLESLRLDLHTAGIRVTDVQPGFVATPMTAGATHPRPLEWTAEKAGRYIVRKLEKAPAVVSFPWPIAFMARLGRHLPNWLYDPIMRSTAG